MSFDRMDNLSGGAPGNLPRRSQVTPQQFEAAQSAPLSRDNDSNADETLLGMVAGRGAITDGQPAIGKSLTQQWADKSLLLGGREFAANAVNQVTRSKAITNNPLLNKYLGSAPVEAGAAVNAPRNYSNLFHLGSKQVDLLKNGNWTQYTNAVKENVGKFQEAVSQKDIGNFFKGVTPQSYLKETVIEGNIKPIKDLVTNSPNKEVGTGLFQTAAVGLMGYDVVKHAHEAYLNAKAKEDGSLKSRLNTYKETLMAVGKYTFRDGATWEAAGLGAAIGRAVLPLALGPVSLGGVAVGALAGLVAQKGLDAAMKTGEKDPAETETVLRKKKPEQENAPETSVAPLQANQPYRQFQLNPFQVQPV